MRDRQLAELYNSRSWRIAAPLRLMRRILSFSVMHHYRRLFRFVHWTARLSPDWVYTRLYKYYYDLKYSRWKESFGQPIRAISDQLKKNWYDELELQSEKIFLTKIDAQKEKSPILTHYARLPQGAVIIRTQNLSERRKLLQEAVKSVWVQTPNLTPIIVVHGSLEDFHNVKKQLSCGNETIFLHAENMQKRRGYPANLALDYIQGTDDRFNYVSFLDDDNILYPCFSTHMGEMLRLGSIDLVYAMTNKRQLWQPVEPGPTPLPASCLVAGNFIPISSYSLSTEFLLRSKSRFNEHLEYLEDWDFLISQLGSGARFGFLPETVSECRITSDGNTGRKKYPMLHAENTAQVREKIQGIQPSRIILVWRDSCMK